MIVAGLLGPRGLLIDRPGGQATPVSFRLSAEEITLGKGNPQGEVILTGDDGFGLRITEALRFRADTYVIERALRIENRHSVAQSADVVLPWAGPAEWPKEQPEKFPGQHPTRAVGFVSGSVHRDEVANISGFGGDWTWVGLESELYLSALVARSPSFKVMTAKNGTTVSELRDTARPRTRSSLGGSVRDLRPKEHGSRFQRWA